MKKTKPTGPITLVLPVRTSAATPPEGWIDKVRPFLLRDFGPDDLYVRQMMLANNRVDRSGERFDEGYLRRFAQTIIGKSVLVGHDYGNAPIGRFFDAEITRDNDGTVWVAPWFYMPKSSGNELERDNIDSGVWSYVSIGAIVDFAGLMCNICGAHYWPGVVTETEAVCPHISGLEYDGQVCTTTWTASRSDMATVEAVEGSIVYLGCQYDAAIAKSAESMQEMHDIKLALLGDNTPPETSGREKEADMDLIQALAKIAEMEPLASKVVDLETQVADLTPKAATAEKLQMRIVSNIKRVAGCLALPEVITSIIDKVADIDELIKLEEQYEAEWARKRGTSPAKSEPAAGADNDTITSVPADRRDYSLI